MQTLASTGQGAQRSSEARLGVEGFVLQPGFSLPVLAWELVNALCWCQKANTWELATLGQGG